jgi:hypothetical protein
MSDEILRPRDNRSSVIIRAAVRTASGQPVERRIRNLSSAGACVEHSGDLAPGDVISLEMGSLKNLQAEVIWSREKVAGVNFSHRIDLDEARKARGTGVTVATGWLAGLQDAYR